MAIIPLPWQPIHGLTPEKGMVILGWCNHEAEPYYTTTRLTVYGAHCEGCGQHADDGPQLLIFGGEYNEPGEKIIPNWWFIKNDYDECGTPANPTYYVIVTPPDFK